MYSVTLAEALPFCSCSLLSAGSRLHSSIGDPPVRNLEIHFLQTFGSICKPVQEFASPVQYFSSPFAWPVFLCLPLVVRGVAPLLVRVQDCHFCCQCFVIVCHLIGYFHTFRLDLTLCLLYLHPPHTIVPPQWCHVWGCVLLLATSSSPSLD